MLRWICKLAPTCLLPTFFLGIASPGLWAQLPSANVEFAPATHGVVTVPVRNGLDMQASVNGQPPLDVLFDTGSGSIMSANLAHRLGLKQEGNSVLAGFGSNTIPGTFARVDNLTIGCLTLHGVYFAVIDPPIATSEEFAVLGDQLVQRLVVTVDFVRQQITFTDASRFRHVGKSKPIPLRVEGNGLEVQGEADGMHGTFGVDTGDVWSLTLLSSFVKKHDLVQHYGAKFQGYGGSGIGGPDHAFYARVHTLRLGDVEVHAPFTFLYTDTDRGSNNSTYATDYAGNIGQHILRQFTVTFDLPHGALYLEKNAFYGKPDIFNRAGLVLDADFDSLTVMTVLPGSPGADAGIAEGDKIMAIDGRPMKQPTGVAALSEAVGVNAFTRPVGTVLSLKIRHGDSERTVSLTLKEIL